MCYCLFVFFFKQKTAYEMRISDWSSDVCSSDLFTREGGVVTLSARRAEGEMLLEVADTGIGIPETDRDRVFGKFERGSLEMRHSGAGLGLSLVKSLIELHGGRVEQIGRAHV